MVNEISIVGINPFSPSKEVYFSTDDLISAMIKIQSPPKLTSTWNNYVSKATVFMGFKPHYVLEFDNYQYEFSYDDLVHISKIVRQTNLSFDMVATVYLPIGNGEGRLVSKGPSKSFILAGPTHTIDTSHFLISCTGREHIDNNSWILQSKQYIIVPPDVRVGVSLSAYKKIMCQIKEQKNSHKLSTDEIRQAYIDAYDAFKNLWEVMHNYIEKNINMVKKNVENESGEQQIDVLKTIQRNNEDPVVAVLEQQNDINQPDRILKQNQLLLKISQLIDKQNIDSYKNNFAWNQFIYPYTNTHISIRRLIRKGTSILNNSTLWDAAFSKMSQIGMAKFDITKTFVPTWFFVLMTSALGGLILTRWYKKRIQKVTTRYKKRIHYIKAIQNLMKKKWRVEYLVIYIKLLSLTPMTQEDSNYIRKTIVIPKRLSKRKPRAK